MNPHEMGRKGETLAIDFFADLGYTIVAHNYCVRGGEIDIVAREADTLVFIEVKTRRDDGFAAACEAVGRQKQKRILHAATRYLAECAWTGYCRFDVVEIYLCEGMPPTIRHWPDAFGA